MARRPIRTAGTVGSQGNFLLMLAGRSLTRKFDDANVSYPAMRFPSTKATKQKITWGANILGHVFPKGAVQWFQIAGKRDPVMSGILPHNLERCVAHSTRKSMVQRMKARFNAWDGCGGDISARAKHS